MLQKKLLIIALLLSTVSFAQFMEGYATSDYAGVNGINYNPASVVDSRVKLDINFFTASSTFSNNYLGFKTNLPNFRDSTLWEKSITNPIGKAQNFQMNLDVLGPSVMFTIDEKRSIGFTSQFRLLSNFTNFSEDIASLYLSQLNNSNFTGVRLNTNEMNFSSASWNEYGIVYGQEIYRNGHHWLSLGGRFKVTQALQAAALQIGDLSVEQNSDGTLTAQTNNSQYLFSENIEDGWRKNLTNFNGWGLGIDLGIDYEWRPKPDSLQYEMDGKTNPAREQSKHKFRFGLALSDLGYVRYNTKSGGDLNGLSTNWNPNSFNLERFEGFEAAIQSAFTTTNNMSGFTMWLPTAMSAQLDYHLTKGFYLNATYNHNIKRDQLLAVHYQNRLTLTPRWDWKWMGLYLPISIREDQQHFGANIMFGPFLIGTRDLGTFLWRNENYFANVHFGIKVTSLHFRPSDFDKDGVSDKMDKCPEIPGDWDFKGCPDDDGDSIPNAQDKCPNTFGLAKFRGCPDSDNDGVMDLYDECPTVAGVKDLNGCPDDDGDGIKNSIDKCPNEIGLAYFNGCPDTDGDSTINKLDACPDEPGLKENLGCPDSDGDGVYNYADSCIDTKGPKENNGCPYKDFDGDGVNNNVDRCPNLFGAKSNKGCPLEDQDNDGVKDALDLCPLTPGEIENDGCPLIDEEDEEIIEFAFKNLQFETGSAIILHESFPSLNALAQMLIEKATWKLKLEGHTDNIGDAQNNLALSKARVEATKTYLINKGVAPNHLKLFYFGETKPLQSNDSPEGRQANRRVVMELIFD